MTSSNAAAAERDGRSTSGASPPMSNSHSHPPTATMNTEPEPEPEPDRRLAADATATATAPNLHQHLQQLPPLATALDRNHYAAYHAPTTPTVSPLSNSTPAVTAVHSTNGDNALDDDRELPKLNDELPVAISTSTAYGGLMVEPSPADFYPSAFGVLQLPPDLREAQQGHAAVATADEDMAFSPHPAKLGRMSRHASIGSIKPALLMSLTADYPTAVAPSEISLQATHTPQGSDAFTGSLEATSASASQKLESFARIEFADSVFQMTTYAVIIGRDQKALRQARKDEWREERYRQLVEDNERCGLPPPTPLGRDKGKFSKSYVSEEGGMLGPESDGEDSTRPARKRRPASSGGRSQPGDDDGEQGEPAKSNRQYVSHTEGAAAVELGILHPKSNNVPFVGIHSPGPEIARKTKVISRKHMKIEFNEKKGVFEGIALHRNGFFCDDILYSLDEPVVIRSGDRLQIKDVAFTFVINGVKPGRTGAEEYLDGEEKSSRCYSIGGKDMSVEFEHSDHEKFRDTSDDLSDLVDAPTPPDVSDDGEEDDNEAGDNRSEVAEDDQQEEVAGAGGDMVLQSAKAEENNPEAMLPQIPRRRGPGRPPKDGVMSKRERRLLKKMEEETSKKTLPQEPPGEKIKRPVGRPRKNPLPENGERPEKRKYNKRKKEDGEEGSDGEARAKDKKDKKVRPKSPPLELKQEDFTEEQLQKPSKNYSILIDEALTNGPPEGLTLKQVYKRIMAKYPWYYFFSETKGWESSVRHNLLGNEAFIKNEESNLWQRVPGVELDAGKKRKAPSPDRPMGPLPPHQMPQQPYFHGGNYVQPGGLNFSNGLPGPAYPKHNQPNSNFQQVPGVAKPHQTYGGSHNPTSSQHPHLVQSQVQPSAQTSAPLLSRHPAGSGPSNYSSPYARSAPTASPHIKAENAAPNPQALPTAPTPQSAAYANTQAQQTRPLSVAPGLNRLVLNEEEQHSIAMYKNKMIEVMMQSTDKATQIVETAVNRALGIPTQPTLQGFETVEDTLIDALHKMLKDVRDKRHNNTSASPAPQPAAAKQATPVLHHSPAAVSAVEATVQRSVKSFRDKMVEALIQRTPLAEKIVDSAINRALGLPNSGAFPDWEQADRLIYENVIKTIADARKNHGLQAQSASPAAQTRQPSQAPPQGVVRQGPSASPAPGPPSAPAPAASTSVPPSYNAVAQSTPTSTATPHMGSKPVVPRPGLSIARPSSIGVSRPGAVSVARPSGVRQNSVVPSPTPATAQVASIASASGPVSTPVEASVAPVAAPVMAPTGAPTSANGSKSAHQEMSAAKTTNPAAPHNAPQASTANTTSPIPLQTMAQTPISKTASPAPPPTTIPSAGAIQQIMGQKRALDSAHGPGAEAVQQPEAKRLATSPPS
ncbi:hypothetical protein BJ170DRAFT_608407 [Xylariales sp. AK1849]|nr:hypothetical protein BJ170DRAFT_608407 [Xylariales sp. AK1849]